ncbi:hypothetical protein FisN_11Hh037 [Fistulifera solaris]|uniref:HSF-type DNA-binding domain-containing protein n=1 Tax=Fistulifera solaris TaxID=1519565 RepID=A0A1Z5JL59_FISSO|nr:hypothetical protein FisN_11Hh037 [Fistulifera solaris]|eukprot:GAX14501.1 hypothetical protein FisN_11Hh037 [Fistulifera solaris]
MIDTCDPEIASWTSDGEMFVVKDPDLFASQIIPLYFEHNKFSSFARQLNFYGFRKMQAKPIRNSDYDAGTAKHVTFYNENFKRGRCDLLKLIQRSTRGGTAATGGDPTKEVQNLREYVSNLEHKISEMSDEFEDRVRRLELDMLARMEQMMLSIQQQQNQIHFQKNTSIGSVAHSSSSQSGGLAQNSQNTNGTFLPYPRGDSIQSTVSLGLSSLGVPTGLNTMSSFGFQQPQMPLNSMSAPPTLPPHPKQKQLPLNGFPPMNESTDRLNSLRGISQFSRGLSRGASVESSASAALLRNSWDEKLFSMLMSEGEHNGTNLNGAALVNPTPMAEGHNAAAQVVSNRSSKYHEDPADDGANDMSSVSSSDIP